MSTPSGFGAAMGTRADRWRRAAWLVLALWLLPAAVAASLLLGVVLRHGPPPVWTGDRSGLLIPVVLGEACALGSCRLAWWWPNTGMIGGGFGAFGAAVWVNIDNHYPWLLTAVPVGAVFGTWLGCRARDRWLHPLGPDLLGATVPIRCTEHGSVVLSRSSLDWAACSPGAYARMNRRNSPRGRAERAALVEVIGWRYLVSVEPGAGHTVVFRFSDGQRRTAEFPDPGPVAALVETYRNAYCHDPDQAGPPGPQPLPPQRRDPEQYAALVRAGVAAAEAAGPDTPPAPLTPADVVASVLLSVLTFGGGLWWIHSVLESGFWLGYLILPVPAMLVLFGVAAAADLRSRLREDGFRRGARPTPGHTAEVTRRADPADPTGAGLTLRE